MSARWSDKQEKTRAWDKRESCREWHFALPKLGCSSTGSSAPGCLPPREGMVYFKPMIGTRVSEMKEINSEMPTVSFRSAFLSFPF